MLDEKDLDYATKACIAASLMIDLKLGSRELATLLLEKLSQTEFGHCLMCDNSQKHTPVLDDGIPRGCNGECEHKENTSQMDFLIRFLEQYAEDRKVLERRKKNENKI